MFIDRSNFIMKLYVMFTEKHRAGYPRSGEGHQSPEGKATSRILIPGKRTSPGSGKELNLTL